VWQWQHHGARLADGRRVDVALVRAILAEEVAALRNASSGDSARRLDLAERLTESMCTSPEMGDFLTLPAYELILTLA
jgi:malate synthase